MNATTPTPADTAKTIKALRKRLERWELEHLRQLAARAPRLSQQVAQPFN